ncbi:hypothetical protein JG688_00012797 [Phytophthora aleatoria]|uniref:Uncharacterized protein n=1 Tax=Phytophthora aleatoria TaxID=2496075 RepID=A0A8J5IJX7_9STRA|nr:hypothetical protein JG688_00012797 [Phytophthora aleatoria]
MSENDLRDATSKFTLVLSEIPIVTNNTMTELFAVSDGVTAYTSRGMLRKTCSDIVEDVITLNTSSNGTPLVAEEHTSTVAIRWLRFTVCGRSPTSSTCSQSTSTYAS